MTGVTGFSPTGRVVTRSGMGASQRLYSIVLNASQRLYSSYRILYSNCASPRMFSMLSHYKSDQLVLTYNVKAAERASIILKTVLHARTHYNHSMRISTRDARSAPPGPQEKMLPGPPQSRKFSRLPRPAPPHPTLKMPRVELLLRPALRILLPARPALKIFLLPRPDPKQKNDALCLPDLKKSASSVPAMALLISKSNQLVLFQLYALVYQLDDM